MTTFILLISFVLVAVGLTVYFLKNDRGEKEPVMALWLAFGMGFLGAIAAGILEGFAISSHHMVSATPLAALFGTALLVGIIEEACKFIPLSAYIYSKRYFNEYTDGIIYFGLAGLGFGLPENIMYTLQYGASAGFGRLLLTPIFHAATGAVVGYFLVRSKLAKRPKYEAWLALVAMMLLHGLYDFGLLSRIQFFAMTSVCMAFGLTVLIFFLYTKASRNDRKLGLSPIRVPRSYRKSKRISTIQAVLSVILGLASIAGVLLMPAVGLALALTSIILATLSYKGARQHIAETGLVMGSVGVIVALAAWAYVFSHMPQSQVVTTDVSGLKTAITQELR